MIGVGYLVLLFLIRGVLAKIFEPTTCRPPLPFEWFISQTQSQPLFSQSLTKAFAAASANLSAAIDEKFSLVAGIDAISMVVAAPWGIVAEHNVGKLRSNDTFDTRKVDGESAYRIGSVSKVFHSKPPWLILGFGRFGVVDFARPRKIVL